MLAIKGEPSDNDLSSEFHVWFVFDIFSGQNLVARLNPKADNAKCFS